MDVKRIFRGPLFWIAVAFLGVMVIGQLLTSSSGYKAEPTSKVVKILNDGDAIKKVTLIDPDQEIRIDRTDGSKIRAHWVDGQSADVGNTLQRLSDQGKIEEYNVENPKPSFIGQVFSTLIPFLLIAIVFIFLMNSMQGGGSRVMSFAKSRAKLISKDTPKTTFSDVAGCDEAIEELGEIKEFLQEPGKFQAVGAKIPKGVLLYGQPGTGKTLLARAVAGEAGVPFYSISGSDFVEMFVGVGASVTGDTPVLVRDVDGIRLMPIGEYVDARYPEGKADYPIRVDGVQTLGYRRRGSGFRGLDGFGGSQWSDVGAVYRHEVDEIYEIHYLGGVIRTTGDHSVFVRGHGGIKAKPTRELRVGETLVDLPYKTRTGFTAALGTQHEVRAHEFGDGISQRLVLRDEVADASARGSYELVQDLAGAKPQHEIAALVGVSQMTVSNWTRGVHEPRAISSGYRRTALPSDVEVTPALLKLFGYYTAEGRANGDVEFCFGSHEIDLLADCADLMERTFGVQTKRVETVDNSTRLVYHSAVLGRFFARHCGNGSGGKHVPELLWTAPFEYFKAFLEGYALGDGYQNPAGKLQLTSVSQQLIRELAWLCAMHGIKAGVGHGQQAGGRVIRSKPLPDGEYWRLTIGSTSNPLTGADGRQHKRPVITKIVRRPYQGYVYDFCGCDNEAFFGGEKPVLLHNSRVRDLFEQAKANAPAIVFIDEIDAVGRHRGAGLGGGHDEREQTLNQLLVEMDGFDVRGGVILIAATNRPDVLDPALLRPGRFDRQIAVDTPDLPGRTQILKVHARGKPMAEDVDLTAVARRTPGFTGADLANVLNEAALLTARSNRNVIDNQALDEAIDRVIAGPQRRTRLMTDKEKVLTAYHEGGHALVAAALPHSDPVHKVTILPRGRALGYTMVLPDEDKYSTTRSEMLDKLAYMLGGRAAEEMVFHDPTTGASNDIEKATALARAMVTQYGMTERLGAIKFGEDTSEPFLGRDLGHQRNYSEEIAAAVDEEVGKLILNAHQEAFDILVDNRAVLDHLVEELLERETLDKAEVARIFEPVRRRPVRPAWTGSPTRVPSKKPPVQPLPSPADSNGSLSDVLPGGVVGPDEAIRPPSYGSTPTPPNKE